MAFSPAIELGSSEVLRFNQCTDDRSLDQVRPAERRRRRKWTPTQDILLISSWLNTSKVGVVGDEHRPTAFWKRVAACYASNPKLGSLQPREPSHCRHRWQKINVQVCKFVEAYEAAKAQETSRHSDDEVLKLAHQIFYNDHKYKFNLEYAWKELRNDQKWWASLDTKTGGSSKRSKCEDGTAQSSSSHAVIEVEDEAVGVMKAAKGKGKRSMSKTSCVESEAMKELAMKERLSKIGLLESLLAKKEALSEIEVALKNKLMTDMLSN